jgi:hypothetical protein
MDFLRCGHFAAPSNCFSAPRIRRAWQRCHPCRTTDGVISPTTPGCCGSTTHRGRSFRAAPCRRHARRRCAPCPSRSPWTAFTRRRTAPPRPSLPCSPRSFRRFKLTRLLLCLGCCFHRSFCFRSLVPHVRLVLPGGRTRDRSSPRYEMASIVSLRTLRPQRSIMYLAP